MLAGKHLDTLGRMKLLNRELVIFTMMFRVDVKISFFLALLLMLFL